MNQVHDITAWSLYWSQDRLYSCVAQSSDKDQKVLNELWHRFAEKLQPNSKLLDLATGNGAVAKALLSANRRLKIDAVDKASIDPKSFLTDQGDLAHVSFHSDTDILDLTFTPSSFDAITSQFGIEYAGLTKASVNVMSHLKIDGCFQFVVHHAQSGIILSSKDKIIELEQLTQESGMLDLLIKVLGGKAEFAQLEALGQDYLQQDLIRTQQVSGQVFTGIERIINNVATHPEESLELGVAMDLRVRSELVRLRQLIAAGQSADDMASWSEAVSETGTDLEYSPLYLDQDKQDYLLGWLATGVRCK